jgi:hypothetical protein
VARFWRTTCAGACSWVEGTWLEWGKLGLRWWECSIERRARVGRCWARNEKPSCWGSVWANDLRGRPDLNSGGLIGVLRGGVCALGPRDPAVREGEGDLRLKLKTERRGSVFANNAWEASDLDSGGSIGEG